MGNRAQYPSTSGGSIGRMYVELKLKLNGAGTPTVLAGNSFLSLTAPPVHVGGSNVVTITMRDTWPEVIYAGSDPRDDAPNGAYATIGTITNEASTTQLPITFKLNTWTAGGAVSNDSTLTVGIVLVIRASNATYGNTP